MWKCPDIRHFWEICHALTSQITLDIHTTGLNYRNNFTSSMVQITMATTGPQAKIITSFHMASNR
jgi:hypothetical protein